MDFKSFSTLGGLGLTFLDYTDMGNPFCFGECAGSFSAEIFCIERCVECGV